MTYNDDEPILKSSDDSVPKPGTPAGRTQVRIIQNPEAPLEETKFKVLLELTGAGSPRSEYRSGADIVAVLDFSASMRMENKLGKLKLAMKFLIRKLSSIHRLSVVTFADAPVRKCRLRQMTEAAKADIEDIVYDLVAGGNTNIADGLEKGLDVLNQRTISTGRTGAVMLMSDGEDAKSPLCSSSSQTDKDATKVPIGNIPVFTFGFGADATVLNAIANNSKGGVFSIADVENTVSSNLSIVAFSQCLGGLLTTAVEDLELVVTQLQSTIDEVSAGSYPQTHDKAAGSVTVSFGNLYNKEVRRVLLDLTLPALPTRTPSSEILRISTKYSNRGMVFEESPRIVVVKRVGSPAVGEKEEVVVEEARLETVRMMEMARMKADDNALDTAKDKIVEAENMLERVKLEEPNPILDMMKSELQQLTELMNSSKTYESKGQPFALSSETSHKRQRHASRGNVEENRMYATPRMDAYLEQAKAFDEDPTQPLPSVEDDEKKEFEADPLAATSGPLNYYLEVAIQALKAMQDVISRGV